MSANGTKRTSLVALHMSAFGGKADIARTRRISAAQVSFVMRLDFAAAGVKAVKGVTPPSNSRSLGRSRVGRNRALEVGQLATWDKANFLQRCEVLLRFVRLAEYQV